MEPSFIESSKGSWLREVTLQELEKVESPAMVIHLRYICPATLLLLGVSRPTLAEVSNSVQIF